MTLVPCADRSEKKIFPAKTNKQKKKNPAIMIIESGNFLVDADSKPAKAK